MNREMLIALGTGTLISSAAAIGISVAGEPAPAAMSPAEYRADLASAEASLVTARARCALEDPGARESCESVAEAAVAQRSADLEERFKRTPDAARRALRARIEATHEADRARCVPLTGVAHDDCLIAAQARFGRALLESNDPYARRD